MANITCPLCQSDIPPEHQSCPTGCPMSGNCGMIRCPHCGYEMPQESKIVSLIRKWMRKDEPERESVA